MRFTDQSNPLQTLGRRRRPREIPSKVAGDSVEQAMLGILWSTTHKALAVLGQPLSSRDTTKVLGQL